LNERGARLAAADLLSRRAWTQAELTARLQRRGAPGPLAAAIVADLATRGYIDDAAFARHWVDVRGARGYGAARLRSELRARGVPGPLVADALSRLTSEGVIERCRETARRRLPALRRGPPARAAARLRDHLLRRGYPAGVVARVLRELVGEVPASDD
jgi:regulatory protein